MGDLWWSWSFDTIGIVTDRAQPTSCSRSLVAMSLRRTVSEIRRFIDRKSFSYSRDLAPQLAMTSLDFHGDIWRVAV